MQNDSEQQQLDDTNAPAKRFNKKEIIENLFVTRDHTIEHYSQRGTNTISRSSPTNSSNWKTQAFEFSSSGINDTIAAAQQSKTTKNSLIDTNQTTKMTVTTPEWYEDSCYPYTPSPIGNESPPYLQQNSFVTNIPGRLTYVPPESFRETSMSVPRSTHSPIVSNPAADSWQSFARLNMQHVDVKTTTEMTVMTPESSPETHCFDAMNFPYTPEQMQPPNGTETPPYSQQSTSVTPEWYSDLPSAVGAQYTSLTTLSPVESNTIVDPQRSSDSQNASHVDGINAITSTVATPEPSPENGLYSADHYPYQSQPFSSGESELPTYSEQSTGASNTSRLDMNYNSTAMLPESISDNRLSGMVDNRFPLPHTAATTGREASSFYGAVGQLFSQHTIAPQDLPRFHTSTDAASMGPNSENFTPSATYPISRESSDYSSAFDENFGNNTGPLTPGRSTDIFFSSGVDFQFTYPSSIGNESSTYLRQNTAEMHPNYGLMQSTTNVLDWGNDTEESFWPSTPTKNTDIYAPNSQIDSKPESPIIPIVNSNILEQEPQFSTLNTVDSTSNEAFKAADNPDQQIMNHSSNITPLDAVCVKVELSTTATPSPMRTSQPTTTESASITKVSPIPLPKFSTLIQQRDTKVQHSVQSCDTATPPITQSIPSVSNKTSTGSYTITLPGSSKRYLVTRASAAPTMKQVQAIIQQRCASQQGLANANLNPVQSITKPSQTHTNILSNRASLAQAETMQASNSNIGTVAIPEHTNVSLQVKTEVQSAMSCAEYFSSASFSIADCDEPEQTIPQNNTALQNPSTAATVPTPQTSPVFDHQIPTPPIGNGNDHIEDPGKYVQIPHKYVVPSNGTENSYPVKEIYRVVPSADPQEGPSKRRAPDYAADPQAETDGAPVKKRYRPNLPYGNNLVCTECDICFGTKSSLRQHQSAAHSEPKPFRCEPCGKHFTTQKLMETHRLNHDPARQIHECGECEKRYVHQNDRNRHYRQHHGVPRFTCSYCEKPFVRHDHLLRHEVAHVNHRVKTVFRRSNTLQKKQPY